MNLSKNTSVLDQSSVNSKPTAEPNLCKICLTEIKKGINHSSICTAKRGAMKNILKLIKNRDIDEPIAVSVINDKIGNNVVNGSLRYGNNKRKNISTKHFKIVEVSTDQSINLMRTGKFSKAQYRLAHAFAKDANGLKKLPTLKNINAELDKRMEGLVSTKWDFFECKLSKLETTNLKALLATGTIKKGEMRGTGKDRKQIYLRKSELTYVNDLEAFYRRIIIYRDLQGDPPIAWKIDDGKKSFKIMWQIINLDDINFCSPDTLQVIAEVPKIPETTRTVHEILTTIGFDSFCSKFKNLLTVDFKMYAILLNIKGSSARHPCIYSAFDLEI